jgi:hypothetical protein
MEKILTEMEQYDYESDGELVEWMRERIDNLDYKDIVERLEEVIPVRFQSGVNDTAQGA